MDDNYRNRLKKNKQLRLDCMALVNQLTEHGFLKKEIADLMGISPGYLYDKLGTTRHFSEKDLLLLEEVVKLEIND